MLAAERQRLILDLVEKHGSVRTVDLARRLDVTDETVRRDLDSMEAGALVRRTHGGAVRSSWQLRDRSFEERRVENIEAKKSIAIEALRLVEEGDVIFVDASSTVLQLVQLLGDFPLTVISHSLRVAEILSGREKIELVLAGGALDRVSASFLGPDTMSVLCRRRVDKVFSSGNGMEPGLGASEVNQQQAMIKEVMASRCARFVYMADSSKLGTPSNFYFAEPSQIDLFITDALPNHPIFCELRQAGMDCVSACKG